MAENARPEPVQLQRLSREELLELLDAERDETGDEKLKKHNIIFEAKKLKGRYGIFKLLIYEKEKDTWRLVFRVALLLPIDPESGVWKELDEGQSKYVAVILDSEPKTATEALKGFIARLIGEKGLHSLAPLATQLFTQNVYGVAPNTTSPT